MHHAPQVAEIDVTIWPVFNLFSESVYDTIGGITNPLSDEGLVLGRFHQEVSCGDVNVLQLLVEVLEFELLELLLEQFFWHWLSRLVMLGQLLHDFEILHPVLEHRAWHFDEIHLNVCS